LQYISANAPLWIQLDIAGVDIATADKGWVSKGASGYSVRALINMALAEAG
jgi:leucyl aminopeptidase